ncbi:MAG: RNB domain-containing ribonuclease, partial [Christensenellales bacterium]
MVTLNGRLKLSGFVVKTGDKYVFKSKKGQEFDIIQDALAEKLAKSREICIFENVPTKNPNDTFGRIVKVIGKGGDPIPEGRAIAENYNLIVEVPYDVKAEVAKIPTYVRPKDAENFVDLRNIKFVTIDPDNAGDYDDAVWAKKNPDGSFELKVAIANVSHYVPHFSELFNFAMQNGNSKYLGNNVYPM